MAGGALCNATRRNASPSYNSKFPKAASQMRTAFSSIAWNTGSNSPGEPLITFRTSEVAVCCSRDSVSSRVRCCSASNKATFSIAITAWSANDRAAIRLERMLFHGLLLLRGEPVACDVMVGTVLGEPDGSPIPPAKARRRLHERVQHRLQIERRAAD